MFPVKVGQTMKNPEVVYEENHVCVQEEFPPFSNG